jgi:hypothetical protein
VLGCRSRSFSQKDGIDTKFVVEGVVKDFLDIFPFGDNAMFNWGVEDENASFSGSFITNEEIFVRSTIEWDETISSWVCGYLME